MFFTENQARVNALLDAEEPELAAPFIRALPETAALSRLRGSAVAKFRAERHLLYLRKDWRALHQNPPPDDFELQDHQAIRDTAAFYSALAYFWQPDGIVNAERVFRQLHERHGNVPAYASNMFAARVKRLLEFDSFALLTGENLREARAALAEAEEFETSIGFTESDRAGLGFNRSLLQLAVGDF